MEREKKIIKTSILGILVNLILVGFKAIIGFIVNSIAIVLDAVNNLTDAISSVVTIVGTKFANKEPDKEHPYGHGRIEYFASVIVSFIVLFAGIIALKESILKIVNPSETDYSIVSLIIVAVAVVVKFVFGRYVKKVGRKVNSQSLVASGEDAFMDSILSLSTLIAGIINYVWHLTIEGYIGVAISIIIIRSAIKILKETLNIMIGQREDKEFTDKIKEKVGSYPEVQGTYDLALHNYGPSKTIADLHIQVRDDMTAQEIHTLTREITVDLFNEFGIFTTIGIYAANDDSEYSEIKQELAKIVQEYKYVKQIHGFYADKKNNKIYFDLIIDFECEDAEELKNRIIRRLESKYSKYKFYVLLDADISD